MWCTNFVYWQHEGKYGHRATFFLTSVLDKCQLLASRPGHFTPGDESRCLWKEGRVYPRISLYHEANNNYNCHQTLWSAKTETREVRRAMPLYLSVKLKASRLQKGIKLRTVTVQEFSPTSGCLCWSTKSCQAVRRIKQNARGNSCLEPASCRTSNDPAVCPSINRFVLTIRSWFPPVATIPMFKSQFEHWKPFGPWRGFDFTLLCLVRPINEIVLRDYVVLYQISQNCLC